MDKGKTSQRASPYWQKDAIPRYRTLSINKDNKNPDNMSQKNPIKIGPG